MNTILYILKAMLKLSVLLTVLPALVAAQVNSLLQEAEPDDGASL